MFEIYSNQESSEKQAENEHPWFHGCLIINDNSQLLENIKISNEFDNSNVKPDLKDSKNQLIPSKLYENMIPNLPKFQKLDINLMNFIPIWYINGSRTSRVEYTVIL